MHAKHFLIGSRNLFLDQNDQNRIQFWILSKLGLPKLSLSLFLHGPFCKKHVFYVSLILFRLRRESCTVLLSV